MSEPLDSLGEPDPKETVADGSESSPAPAPPAPAWPDGTLIQEFRVLRLLGRGANGCVYLVEHTGGSGRFALKALNSNAGTSTRARFEREARILAALAPHPHVARVLGADVYQGSPYFVMQFAGESDLRERLRRGPLPPTEAAALIAQLARGLSHVHAHGVLHRDLKPSNVVYGSDGLARLVDFGLARTGESDALTRSGELIGTPAYMSPEQTSGRSGNVGFHTDVYGLGALLYHCLTGHPPYEAPSLVDLLALIKAGDPKRPRDHDPEIPPELEQICLQALATSPLSRQPSAADLADELEGFLRGGRTQAQAQKSPILAALAGLCLGLLLGALAGAASSGPKVAPPPSPPPGPTPTATKAASPSQPSGPSPPPSATPLRGDAREAWLRSLSPGDTVLVGEGQRRKLLTILEVLRAPRSSFTLLDPNGEARAVEERELHPNQLVRGAAVEHETRGAGTLVRFRGTGFALVEFARRDERVWVSYNNLTWTGPRGHLELPPLDAQGERRAARDRQAVLRWVPWGKEIYVGDVFEERAGRFHGAYLDDDSPFQFKTPPPDLDLLQAGRAGRVKVGSKWVRCTFTGRRLGPWAAEVELATGEKRWTYFGRVYLQPR